MLTTSRAPLRLAAERAVPLSQLSAVDAGQLFVQRAAATRPDAVLDPTAVRDVVDRLDGLPLAVELAAARVRTMTVAEVAAALDDRFAALRSRDRTTPDRHRTLEAVIAWSWDLLGADEQRALAWLSVFQDGFDRATAVSVLGADGSDLVDALVEQSLLVVTEDGGTARFRALETIREYAAARLAHSGEEEAAGEAQRRWARDLAERCQDLVVTDDQVALVDLLVRDQNNLTDVLRHALGTGDRETVARLVALLGSLWTVTGDQPRIFAVCDAATELLSGWDVPPDLRRHAQEAAGVLMLHLSWMPGADLGGLRDLLLQGDRPVGVWGLIAHTVHVVDGPAPARLAEVAAHQSRPGMAGALLHVGGDRLRERRRRGRRADLRRGGPGRAVAALPPRLAPRRAGPAGDGRRRPPPGGEPRGGGVAAAGAHPLDDRRLQPPGGDRHRAAAGRRRRRGGGPARAVRPAGRRDRSGRRHHDVADRPGRARAGARPPRGRGPPLRRGRRPGDRRRRPGWGTGRLAVGRPGGVRSPRQPCALRHELARRRAPTSCATSSPARPAARPRARCGSPTSRSTACCWWRWPRGC